MDTLCVYLKKSLIAGWERFGGTALIHAEAKRKSKIAMSFELADLVVSVFARMGPQSLFLGREGLLKLVPNQNVPAKMAT